MKKAIVDEGERAGIRLGMNGGNVNVLNVFKK